MRGQAILTALAVALTSFAVVPTPAAHAQTVQYQAPVVQDPACQAARRNRMIAGAVIGGVAGAVLGREVAARNTRTEGTVLGGAAGAAAGAAIGRSTANAACQNVYQQGAQNQYPNQYPTSGYGGYGYGAGQTPQNCRWGTETVRDRNGRSVSQQVYQCQGPDRKSVV